MPSPKSKTVTHLCIFGDSHLGCLKAALDQSLVEMGSIDVEFWGAYGPEFRSLRLVDGKVEPDEVALEKVRMVNGRGRDILSAVDFDAVLVMGARTRLSDYFGEMMDHHMQPTGYISKAALLRATENWLNTKRAYRIAKEFARTEATRIMLFATPLHSDGVIPDLIDKYGAAQNAAPQDYDTIWESVQTITEKDDITLLRQPKDTVTKGFFTKYDYAASAYRFKPDIAHKSPEFGARVLELVIAQLGNGVLADVGDA